MSDHIGGIIKLVAVILCILGIILSFVEAFAIGFGGLLGSCCGSLMGGIFIYGFGHLIDETSRNRQMNEEILNCLKAMQREKNPADAPREVPVAFNEGAASARKVAAIATGDWVCEKCGTRNSSNAISCKECGAYK